MGIELAIPIGHGQRRSFSRCQWSFDGEPVPPPSAGGGGGGGAGWWGGGGERFLTPILRGRKC